MGRIKKIPFDKFDPPAGSNLFDIRYHARPSECFEVIYWDGMSKQLEVVYIEPIIDIWFLKPEERTNEDQLPQVEMDRCYVVYCKPSQIPEVIAKEIGGRWRQTYETYKEDGFYRLKEEMCKCPWVFKADFLPDVYLRLQWMKRFGAIPDVTNVTFGLLDIEVDVLDQNINVKDIQIAPQPINVASIILPEQKIVALFVLGPRPKHKLHETYHALLEKQTKEWEWLVSHQEEFIDIIRGNKGTVKLDHYNIEFDIDEDNKKYIGDYDIRIHLFDFEKELNLIATMFAYIHKYRPMFMLAWNATFDDNYILKRIEYLGADPREIWIPEEIKTNRLYFAPDKSKLFSLKNSKDWMYCSSFTQHVCHLRMFAAIRKSQQEKRSYSLSSIGKDIAKIDKLTATKSGSFRSFAYTDFLKFNLYNIRDVVVELAIELKCQDCKSFVSRSYMFATQYSKCFQETHIVRNTREWFFELSGYVQACRLVVDPNIDTAYKGAFVAPPENNISSGLILLGKMVNFILYGVMDADASAYYPSTKMAGNMDPMSLLFKCLIDNDTFLKESINRSFNQEYVWFDNNGKSHPEDMSGPIFNSFKNDNIMSLSYNWLNVPSITETFEYLDYHSH